MPKEKGRLGRGREDFAIQDRGKQDQQIHFLPGGEIVVPTRLAVVPLPAAEVGIFFQRTTLFSSSIHFGMRSMTILSASCSSNSRITSGDSHGSTSHPSVSFIDWATVISVLSGIVASKLPALLPARTTIESRNSAAFVAAARALAIFER